MHTRQNPDNADVFLTYRSHTADPYSYQEVTSMVHALAADHAVRLPKDVADVWVDHILKLADLNNAEPDMLPWVVMMYERALNWKMISEKYSVHWN